MRVQAPPFDDAIDGRDYDRLSGADCAQPNSGIYVRQQPRTIASPMDPRNDRSAHFQHDAGGRPVLRIWPISDLHMEVRNSFDPVPPEFDVLVCAGDVVHGAIEQSIEMGAALGRGRPCVFVAGNHEWAGRPLHRTLEAGYAAAREHGVHFLECGWVSIGGLRFAGTTLWTPLDVRFGVSVKALRAAEADVVVTHFEPPADALTALRPGGLWIHGHHHGYSERTDRDMRRIVRNAVGYPDQDLGSSAKAVFDLVVEAADPNPRHPDATGTDHEARRLSGQFG